MNTHGGARNRRTGSFAFDEPSQDDRERESFLSLGKQPDVLYKHGKCISCGIPLFGKEPKARNLCGPCRMEVLNGSLTAE